MQNFTQLIKHPIAIAALGAITAGATIALIASKPKEAAILSQTNSVSTPSPKVTVTVTPSPNTTPGTHEQKLDIFNNVAKSFEPKINKIGDDIEFGGRKIKVVDIAEANDLNSGNQFIEPVKGRIICISFLATNTSDSTGNMTFSNFTLKDSQGRKYSELDAQGYYSWRQSNSIQNRSSDLYPGERRFDVAAFRVAPDASGFSMTWNRNVIALQKPASESQPYPISSPKFTPDPHTSEVKIWKINGKSDKDHVNLRSEPNTQSSVVAEVHTGDDATYIEQKTNETGELWYRVSVGKNTGWVYSDLILTH